MEEGTRREKDRIANDRSIRRFNSIERVVPGFLICPLVGSSFQWLETTTDGGSEGGGTNAGLGSQLLDTVELRLSIDDDLLIKFRFEDLKLGKVGGIPTGTNRDGIRAVQEPFARTRYMQ